jgi:hypothetical protein
MAQPAEGAVHYEPTDAEPRLLAALAGGTAAFLVLTPCILLLFYPGTAQRGSAIGQIHDIPSPRLQIDPARDLAAFRRAEHERVSSYGWSDHDRTAVHIPIDRAISLIGERGLPGWQKP